MKYTLLFLVFLLIPKHAITPLRPKNSLHEYVPGPNGLIFEDIQNWEQTSSKTLTSANPDLFLLINATAPNHIVHQILKLSGKTIFDKNYVVEEFAFRKNPAIKDGNNKHFIIAGDSNTFGQGVDESSTPSYLIAKKLNYHPYNFGIRGGGPHNTLALMEFFPWENIIHETKGIFIYNYYDNLLERVIGAKNYVKWSHGKAPKYELENGEVVFKGAQKESLLVKTYIKIGENKWLDRMLPVLPKHRDAHLELLVKIFQKMQRIYLQKFPYGHFYVVINYSMGEYWPGRLKTLSGLLKKNRIDSFIIPKIIDEKNDLLADGHLNESGHKKEAQQIYEELVKKEPQMAK